MLKSEFIHATGQEISDEDYEVVETVYMSYPNMDKVATMALWNACGLVSFKDLLPRARRIVEAEATIHKHNQEIKRLQEGGQL